MRFDIQTMGLHIQHLRDGEIELTVGESSITLTNPQLKKLVEVVGVISTLLESNDDLDRKIAPAPRDLPKTSPLPSPKKRVTEARPKPEMTLAPEPPRVAKKEKASPIAAVTPAPKSSEQPTSLPAESSTEPVSTIPVYEAKGSLIIDGEVVKRGPRQSAKRAGVRQGKRRGRPPKSSFDREARRQALFAPGAPTKRGPRQVSEKIGSSSLTSTPAPQETAPPKTHEATPKATPETTQPSPSVEPSTPKPQSAAPQSAPTRATKKLTRAQISQNLADWMQDNPGPKTIESMITLATDSGWETANNARATIQGLLGQFAQLFARQPNGSFILRSQLQTSSTVIRRRGPRHSKS